MKQQLLVVLLSATVVWGQHPSRPGNATPPAGRAPTVNAPATNVSGARIGTNQVNLVPGWGQAPNPGYGNINHPGGVVPSILPLFVTPFPSVVQPLVNPFETISQRPHRRHMNTVIVPYVVPAPYYGEPQPTVIYVTPPAREQPLVQVETQAPPREGPGVWGGSQPPLNITNNNRNNVTVISPRSEERTEPAKQLTLLVFKDHSIYAVTDYWIEDGRLAYITNYGSKNSVGIDQLDLDFTLKLNEERNVKFELRRKPSTETP